MLRRPHFAKYAMRSFRIKLYQVHYGGRQGCIAFFGQQNPVEWVIGGDLINPTERCFACLLNDDFMCLICQTGKKSIDDILEPTTVNPLEGQALILLGPTIIKIRNDFVSSIAKRFGPQMVERNERSFKERMDKWFTTKKWDFVFGSWF
ncbi:hypothetical protein MBLNU457_1708t1 [Dothideomycetes sp. NU457]